MNRKVIVVVLLLITVVVGIIAIYLATTLKPGTVVKPAVKVTPTVLTTTPNLSVSVNPSISITTTNSLTIIPTTSNITPTTSGITGVACGLSCVNSTCSSGNTCLTINNIKKCVSLACVTQDNNTYVPNGTCNDDLCTGANLIAIAKTGAVSCVTDQNNRKLKIKIKITNSINNSNTRTNVSVLDQFNLNLKDSYIVITSISDGGKLENGKITWSGITLGANGGSKELLYEAIIPITDKGKDFSNTVVVMENGINKGSYIFSYPVDILPCTAIISDNVDRIIIGLLILITGIYFYKNNWHYKVGQKFWNYGGRNLTYSIKEIILSVTHEEKGNLERRLLKKDTKK